MVRSCAHERRQQTVMNIDDALRIAIDEIVRENLHVAGEDHEIRYVLINQRLDFFFGFFFVFFTDRNYCVRDFVKVCDGLVVGMIGNDQRNVADEFAAVMAIEKINEAVIVLRDENNHALLVRRQGEPPVHLEFVSDRGKMLAEVGEVPIGYVDVKISGIEFDPHEEQAGFFVGVFVGMEDVAAVAIDEIGNGGDFAFGVGAGDEEDGGGSHVVGMARR